ncbi:MAG: TolC family protein [Gammaproteobacteria bacterium]|nr:TolC family protein [Gammaproteobacteria bacterium]MBQ0840162.1 TolC family protein [Gammaproteobacteria bacterium]
MFSIVPILSRVCVAHSPLRRLAIIACSLALLPISFMPYQAVAASSLPKLELQDAIKRTLEHNPQLLTYGARFRGVQARAITAKQSPPLALGLSVENFAGSGEHKKFDAAELTLSLSSVLELGGKRSLRSSLVSAEAEKLAVARDLETLNLLGELTQAFISTRALQERLHLADEAIGLAESTYKIVKRRADAGASPEAEVWRAKAALTQTKLARDALLGHIENQKFTLSAFWGARNVDFQSLSGDLYAFTQADSFESLYQRASAKPLIQIYASEQRIRELDLQAARAAGKSDIQWQLGLRRLEDGDDNALVAGFSLPLFASSRNEGRVGSALAAMDEVQYQQQSALLALHTRLRSAYRQREISIQALEKIRTDLLPALERALVETRKAYEHGRYTYVDWSAAQRELQAGKQLLIDSAVTALLNQTLIEQLSGEALAQIQPQPATETTAN